jgi:glycosyltransferase involved in cell wall biosynthesis
MFLEKAMREGAAVRGRPAGMLSVCFVAPHAWPVFSGERSIPVVGGAEVQQAILARLFASRGYRVSMISLDFGQPPQAEISGVQVHRIFNMQHGLPVLRFVHPRLSSMWRALKAVDADIYYYRSAAMWVGVLAEFCRRYGKRLVYAGASDKDFDPDQGGQIRFARDRWLFRRGVARAHAIVAQNEHQRRMCRQTFGREAQVIPSCYVAPEPRCAREDIVLWVGTMHENKRPELFIELARKLPRRKFVMIGGPGLNAAFYEETRRACAAVPNVEFKGFLPLAEAETWFDRARVFVNTSLYEGMPNTFLQAWARGVPTVATVDMGVPAHRVAPTVDDLAKEIEAAWADPSRGQACRQYFERSHSSAYVFERYDELFRSIRQ